MVTLYHCTTTDDEEFLLSVRTAGYFEGYCYDIDVLFEASKPGMIQLHEPGLA